MSKSNVPKKKISTKKVKKDIPANKSTASRTKKSVSTQKRKVSPTVSRIKSGTQSTAHKEKMLFQRQNFLLMGAGVGLIALGLILMIGGQMPDPNTWDDGIIYSFRITVLAPIIILSGLVLEIVAIFKK